jgi:hypothetical protein
MKTTFAAVAVALFGTTASLGAQTAADSAAIRATALDYIEGWYAGNAERMTQALHPELAKRIMMPSQANGGRREFQHMGAATLIEFTRQGGGSRTPAVARRTEVRILDIFRGAASVRVDASDWVDYLQVGRDGDGRWVIVNVLWELRSGGGKPTP